MIIIFIDRFLKQYEEVEKNPEKYRNTEVRVPLAVFGKKLFGRLILVKRILMSISLLMVFHINKIENICYQIVTIYFFYGTTP